jgi:hypothetical protein
MYNNDRYYGDSAINQTGILNPCSNLPDAIEELSVQGPLRNLASEAALQFAQHEKWNEYISQRRHLINHNGFGDAANYFQT